MSLILSLVSECECGDTIKTSIRPLGLVTCVDVFDRPHRHITSPFGNMFPLARYKESEEERDEDLGGYVVSGVLAVGGLDRSNESLNIEGCSFEILPRHIQALREHTGCGLSDCRRALQESQGDTEKATKWLMDQHRKYRI